MTFTLFLYNFILIFSTICIYLSEKCRNTFDKKFFLLIAWLSVTIPAALRYNIGIDYRGYLEIYNSIYMNYNSYVEIGFKVLTQFIIYFFDSSDAFFIITSALIYYLLFKSYPKKNGYIINYFFVGLFYLLSYTFIRSYIVLGFSMLAIMSLVNDRKHANIKFVITILAAALFHKSAILLLPIIFFKNRFLSKLLAKYNIIVLLALIVFFVLRFEIVDMLISLPIVSISGYGHYLDNSYYMRVIETGSGLGILFKFILLSIPIIFAKAILKNNKNHSVIIFSCIYAIIALCLGLTYFIFDRIQYLFFFAFILSPYTLTSLIKIKKYKLIVKILIVFLSLGVLIIFQKEIISNQSNYCQGHRVSPYVSIFNKDADTSLEYGDASCHN